jgi:hypothetical protein
MAAPTRRARFTPRAGRDDGRSASPGPSGIRAMSLDPLDERGMAVQRRGVLSAVRHSGAAAAPKE